MTVIKHEVSGGLVDRKGWGAGPWSNEPDKVVWVEPYSGLPCLAVRTGMGTWCGYAGLHPSHPLFGRHYDDDLLQGVDVHGGLTFAGNRGAEGKDGLWWLGFDCAHYQDLIPVHRALVSFRRNGDTYRPLQYVLGECVSLAAQLHALGEELSYQPDVQS